MLVRLENEGEESSPTLLFSRARVDRRANDQDRRRVYSLDYFEQGGSERRNYGAERRLAVGERRNDWAKESRWFSVYLGSRSNA